MQKDLNDTNDIIKVRYIYLHPVIIVLSSYGVFFMDCQDNQDC